MAFQTTVAMRIRAAYLTLHRRANALFLPLGFTADQFVLMSVLAEQPGIIQTTLSGLIATDANTVTAMLRVLERRGLIAREAHAGDGRARRVRLTPQGKRALRTLTRASASLHRELNALAMSAGGDAFTSALDRIAAAMAPAPATRRPRPRPRNPR